MARGQINESKITVERLFKFTLPTLTSNQDYVLQLPIRIPVEEPVEEFVHRIVNAFSLPLYIHDGLLSSLKNFINSETIKYYDDISNKEIEESKSTNFDIEDVVKSWEKAFKTETVEYSEPVGTTDEELFSMAYHKLVHSPALEVILQAEQSYAATAGAAAAKRSQQISKLAEMQDNEMAAAVKELHLKVTEKDINDLAAKHFEEHSLAAGRLNSEVEALHKAQQKEYRTWLMTVLEQQAVCPSKQQTAGPSPLSSPASANLPDNAKLSINKDIEPWPVLEESFTIQLGSQMKQMHNVRILSANVLDFCKYQAQSGGIFERLDTALSLYSTNLHGVVLLSDVGPIEGFTGLAKDFADVCQQTTEFHFSTLDDQLQAVRSQVKQAVAWRGQKAVSRHEQMQAKRPGTSKNLQVGDVHITKHSNLSQVHVVFHMLIDDSVKSNDMNSRHPVILGLRNVLKTAASHDVTTLTLPLLLAHEMTEEMTVAWCSKRAELVFKCVKGFMIEASNAGGADLHNLQFLVPTGISPELFSTLATMLPSIFRVSNPLVLEASSSQNGGKRSKR